MRINNFGNVTLFELLIGRNTAKMKKPLRASKSGNRDCLEISAAGNDMLVSQKKAGSSNNRKVDQSINLQTYIDNARSANQRALENAGNEIKANNAGVYQDNYHAFKNALVDKYSKLADQARLHSDPESYIEQKYFDKTCSYYASDLTAEERQIAYNYEKQMLNTGTIKGVKYQDSLFRGINVNGDAVDAARNAFNRQMINAQIGNIFKSNGIDWSEGDLCTFSVDPYSYYISVEGVNEDIRQQMENVLNVGENGKNLYLHIKKCATQDGANSSQISEDGMLKYQAYQQVLDFTGLKLNELEEHDGSYYTEMDQDICDVADLAIDNSPNVPDSHKQQMKDWIRQMISRLSMKGWKNMPDMFLKIDYSGNGLIDKGQEIQFSLSSSWLRGLLDKSYITI